MDITFHIPSEHERFQTRIGRWSLQAVGYVIERNKLREAYGSTEGSIVLTVPNKDHQGVN